MKIKVYSLILMFLWVIVAHGQIKVACIGNSITELSGYTGKLEKMLGSQYKVTNMGKSGATLLYVSDYPWIEVPTYLSYLLQLKPDIITIKLGTNDSKSGNWSNYKQNFVRDYNRLIDTLLNNISPKPKIYICLPCPSTSTGDWINGTIIRDEIIPKIREVAKARDLPIIDVYTPMLSKMSLFPDGIHPNADGSTEIAKVLYNGILNNPLNVESLKLGSLLNIYPNPAKTELYLTSNIAENATYEITSIEGKALQTGTVINEKINIETLKTGIYIIKIKTEAGECVQRFVKE